MFTVVIAEKKVFDSINGYSAFLKPFEDEKNVAFCEWNTEGKTLREAVPGLEKTVRYADRWRALIVMPDGDVNRKNPFDLVEFKEMPELKAEKNPPKGAVLSRMTDVDEERPEEARIVRSDIKEHFDVIFGIKKAQYEKAARNPLTRLAAQLCEQPSITNWHEDETIGESRRYDADFLEYLREQKLKREIRRTICEKDGLRANKPETLVCVSKRCFDNTSYDVPLSWETHYDLEYSDFTDRNLYFGNMLFLVYDTVPETHRDARFREIKFLETLLLTAENGLPGGAVRSGILYRIDSLDDADGTDKLLSNYASKIKATKKLIYAAIEDIEGKEDERLSDKDASDIFCGSVTVPVTVSNDVKESDMFSSSKIGLSGDCPREEKDVWNDDFMRAKRTLKLLLKQPRRALRAAAADMRRTSVADCRKALSLNEIQEEDLREHIGEQETAMMNTDPTRLFDADEFFAKMDKEDAKVRRALEKRMKRKTTGILGAVVLALTFISFLPALFSNAASVESFVTSLGMTVLAIALTAAASFITLFFLRTTLRNRIKDYNTVAGGIIAEIRNSLSLYSYYLSRACDVSRGFSVLKYRSENEPSDLREVRVLKKHYGELALKEAELRELFGRFITGKYDTSGDDAEPYDYDFSRVVEYDYPMPYGITDERTIDFVEEGNRITVPVSTLSEVIFVREELYDKESV
ncbi:MAG: hypothetical protein IJS65_00950 [Clostridia bacterium]|nr:hypothetical protein [Clostridia bacterium]